MSERDLYRLIYLLLLLAAILLLRRFPWGRRRRLDWRWLQGRKKRNTRRKD